MADLRINQVHLVAALKMVDLSTNEHAEVTYITSVHFKEIMLCERGAFVIPKSVCVASKQPIFSLQ